MKTTLFTAGQVMACLMLISAGAFADDTDRENVSAEFHLSARYRSVTCEPKLLTDRKIGDTTIDFGTFSQDTPSTSKSVVLTLDCHNGTNLPDTVKVGFQVINQSMVDGDLKNRLYPSYQNTQQTNLYYDWKWGKNINNTLRNINPDDMVDLGTVAYDVVEGQTKTLNFPLDITRGTKDKASLVPGDYTAAVTVNVSYE